MVYTQGVKSGQQNLPVITARCGIQQSLKSNHYKYVQRSKETMTKEVKEDMMAVLYHIQTVST